MREYNYRTVSIPDHLNSSIILEEFNKNNTAQKYISNNTPYNDSQKTIKNTLRKIYNDKCAYCESSLHNEDGEIEHYRPKKSSNLSKCDGNNAYYWLAFSWDNLIPCCKICNRFKSNCFDIFNLSNRAVYNNESFKSLHTSLKDYNELENPKLIHPEMDKFEGEIYFRLKGKLISNNFKVRYTTRICKLNRKKLAEAREKILSKHQSDLKKYFLALLKLYKQKKLNNDDMLSILEITFDSIFDFSNKDKPYSMVSQYIINNFDIYINYIPKLQDIDKKILLHLWNLYKKNKSINSSNHK